MKAKLKKVFSERGRGIPLYQFFRFGHLSTPYLLSIVVYMYVVATYTHRGQLMFKEKEKAAIQWKPADTIPESLLFLQGLCGE